MSDHDDWLLKHRDAATRALQELRDLDMSEVTSLYASLKDAAEQRLPSLELILGRKWYTIVPDSKWQQYYFFDACEIRNILAREDE